MSTILVTGASGFIGQALSTALAEQHDVICMSRKSPELDLPWIKGEFSSFEDLRMLDDCAIDAVVHLAAVTSWGKEREQIMCNVEGTRCLMRYLRDRGCRKYVMASSIAAVGMQSVLFRPLQVPIPDEHPSLDRDGYGMSKTLMEEITKYCQRQNPEIEVVNFRLASIGADDSLPAPARVRPLSEWAMGSLTVMALSDAIRAFTMAVEAPLKPGVRIMNAAGPEAWAADPVADILRNWYGDEVDLSHFEQPGHEYAAVYDVSRIEAELGFVAKVLPQR